MTGLIIGGVIVLALIAFGVMGFNKLRTSDVAAQEALGGIDVQLTRRADRPRPPPTPSSRGRWSA